MRDRLRSFGVQRLRLLLRISRQRESIGQHRSVLQSSRLLLHSRQLHFLHRVLCTVSVEMLPRETSMRWVSKTTRKIQMNKFFLSNRQWGMGRAWKLRNETLPVRFGTLEMPPASLLSEEAPGVRVVAVSIATESHHGVLRRLPADRFNYMPKRLPLSVKVQFRCKQRS